MNYKNSDFYAIKADSIFTDHYNISPGPRWSEIVMMKDSLDFFSNVIYVFDQYFLRFTDSMSDEVITRILLDDVPNHLQEKVYTIIYPNLIMKLLLSNKKVLLNDLKINRIPNADDFYDSLYDEMTFHVSNYAEDEFYSLTDFSIKTNNNSVSTNYFISFILNYAKELYEQLYAYINPPVNSKIVSKVRFFKNSNLHQLDDHAVNIAWRLQEVLKQKNIISTLDSSYIGIYINGNFYEWDIYDDNIYNNIIYIWLSEGETYELL